MLVMPRRADLGEHRNDHQIATSRRLAHLPGLWVVDDEEDLRTRMSSFQPAGGLPGVDAVASSALIATIRDFVSTARRAA
jgi:UDP-N-acetylglucosamine transferase subunit ALG13